MNKRRSKRNNKKRFWLTAIAAVGIITISSYMAVRVLAAPENPMVEEQMAQGAGAVLQAQLERAYRQIEKSVSGNDPAILAQEREEAKRETLRESLGLDPRTEGVPLVAVDAGHGGADEGCSFQGVLEKDVNLSISRLLKQKLEALGYQVWLVREDDSYIAKEMRVEMANTLGVDVYISIHQNSSEVETAAGVEAWCSTNAGSSESERLTRLVHSRTIEKTGAKEREIRDGAALCVTGKTQAPACLIETGFLSNGRERALLCSTEYQEKIVDGIAEGVDLFFHPKTMYLTFDDGPSVENTGMVLDILKEKGIYATFFLVGENVRKYPEMARRIVAEGHTIGIHCDSHDYHEIYASKESYLEDFEKAWQTVLDVTGVETKLFRFPGGSVNAYNAAVRDSIIEEMTARGFIYYDWNASLEDAVKKAEPDELIANAKNTALGRKKVVMLAHDVTRPTALCLARLLEQFPEYVMKPLTPEVEPIQFRH